MNERNILLAKANPNVGIPSAQAPKQNNQESEKPSLPNNNDEDQDSKTRISGTRDETASTSKRTRSLHISIDLDAKEGSLKMPKPRWEILPNEGPSKSSDSVHKVLSEVLVKYKNKDSKYSGLTRIISPEFLMVCYSLIKSNPGNMSPGYTPETLDGINEK